MIPKCYSSCKHQKVKVQAYPCCGCILNPDKWLSGFLKNWEIVEDLMNFDDIAHSNTSPEKAKYMVFVPGGPYTPKTVYTLSEAKEAAEKMAAFIKSREVFIVQIVGKIQEKSKYEYVDM